MGPGGPPTFVALPTSNRLRRFWQWQQMETDFVRREHVHELGVQGKVVAWVATNGHVVLDQLHEGLPVGFEDLLQSRLCVACWRFVAEVGEQRLQVAFVNLPTDHVCERVCYASSTKCFVH